MIALVLSVGIHFVAIWSVHTDRSTVRSLRTGSEFQIKKKYKKSNITSMSNDSLIIRPSSDHKSKENKKTSNSATREMMVADLSAPGSAGCLGRFARKNFQRNIQSGRVH